MTNINLNLNVALDGSETHMIAVLVDSWGDKQVVPLHCEMTIEPADYFMPCAHCGNAVLACNFENGSDCCDRCNEGHKSGFIPETKFAGTNQQILEVKNLREVKMELTHMPTVETRIKVTVNENLDMGERIAMALETAALAFWDVIARSFPEAVSGDYLMENLEDVFRPNVEHWVDNNVPKPETQKPCYRGDKEDLDELHLHYPETWHLMHTGGGCMVALTDNVVVAMNHNYIGVTSECVCVYTDTFDQDNFMVDHIADWTFGDNPTVLMNIIDEFMGGAALWDTGKLFDDIMTIAKSGKC
jgi:hypothetical protein